MYERKRIRSCKSRVHLEGCGGARGRLRAERKDKNRKRLEKVVNETWKRLSISFESHC